MQWQSDSPERPEGAGVLPEGSDGVVADGVSDAVVVVPAVAVDGNEARVVAVAVAHVVHHLHSHSNLAPILLCPYRELSPHQSCTEYRGLLQLHYSVLLRSGVEFWSRAILLQE